MDWLFKAMLTATTVWVVMWAARRCGHRVAGVVAALPTITAPTIAWLAQEHGLAFATSAAVGSVAACAMLAVFALGYAVAARRGGMVVAVGCGLLAALAMAGPAQAVSTDLGAALALAFGCCTVVATLFKALPEGRGTPDSHRRRPRSPVAVAVTAGAMTAVAAMLGPSLGGFATGLLASLPLISCAVAMAEHAVGGQRAATSFLRGYAFGLFGKAAFGAVFVWLAAPLGPTAALAIGCACAGLVSTAGGPRAVWPRGGVLRRLD